MTKEDRDKLDTNYTSFQHMSSTLEIISKLFSRKVIRQDIKEGLERKYKREGPIRTNGNVNPIYC